MFTTIVILLLTQGRPAIDVDLSEQITPVRQTSTNTCWASVATMLVSWRDGKPYTIIEAMADAGEEYARAFENNRPLMGTDKDRFLAALRVEAEAPQDFSLSGWVDLLRKYGPLWVTTEGPGDVFSVHAILVTGIYGDGSPTGTRFRYVDPLGGLRKTETLQLIMDRFDAVGRADMGKDRRGDFRPQVVHASPRSKLP